MSATRLPANVSRSSSRSCSSTPRSMARNVSMLSSTPLTELTSSATASDVVAPAGSSARLSRKRFGFTASFVEALGSLPSPPRSAAAIAARASARVGASSSESESSPLTSSPSRQTRARETDRLGSAAPSSSSSRLSRTVRTASSSSCAVVGEGCAESSTGDDGRRRGETGFRVPARREPTLKSREELERRPPRSSGSDAVPSARAASVGRESRFALVASARAFASAAAARAAAALASRSYFSSGSSGTSSREWSMLMLPSSSPFRRADEEGSWSFSGSGSSSPSMAPRSAAALALSRRHGAAGDASALDPAGLALLTFLSFRNARMRCAASPGRSRSNGVKALFELRRLDGRDDHALSDASSSPPRDDADQEGRRDGMLVRSFPPRALQSRGREGRTRLPNAVVAGRSRVSAPSPPSTRVGRPLRPNAPATPVPFRSAPNRAPGTPGEGVAEGS